MTESQYVAALWQTHCAAWFAVHDITGPLLLVVLPLSIVIGLGYASARYGAGRA